MTRERASLAPIASAVLDMMHTLTGMESTYITRIDRTADRQTILHADNRGALLVPEGLDLAWQDALCRRAEVTGIWATDDIGRDLPGSQIATGAGVLSYIGVPILDENDELVATVCGVSSERHRVSETARPGLLVLAQLIAEQWNLERLRQSEVDHHLGSREAQARQHAIELAEAEHKLKSPLAVIVGWSETLLDHATVQSRPELLRGLRGIQEAGHRATAQLDALLEHARIEDRTATLAESLHPMPVNLSGLVESVGEQLAQILTDGHRLQLTIQPDLWVRADAEATHQILWHLAENAVKYSPDGGLISLTLREVIDPQVANLPPQASVTVADTGIGLPSAADQPTTQAQPSLTTAQSELIDNLFRPFARGQNTATIPGTGLGLNIVQRLTHAMRGTVTAIPNYPCGACFTVTLPTIPIPVADSDKSRPQRTSERRSRPGDTELAKMR